MRIVKRTKRVRRGGPEEDLPPDASLLRYIESSALVTAMLERDAEAFAHLNEIGQRITSALTVTEAHRAVLRARADRRITLAEERSVLRVLGRFVRRIGVIGVTEEILDRASRPFPVEPVRTLDAIHLATLESLGETPQLVTVITCDERIARNARALGYQVA